MYVTPSGAKVTQISSIHLHCVSKIVPTFKLSATLSKLNWFSKFWHCWKAYEICYKTPWQCSFVYSAASLFLQRISLQIFYTPSPAINLQRHSVFELSVIITDSSWTWYHWIHVWKFYHTYSLVQDKDKLIKFWGQQVHKTKYGQQKHFFEGHALKCHSHRQSFWWRHTDRWFTIKDHLVSYVFRSFSSSMTMWCSQLDEPLGTHLHLHPHLSPWL